MKILVTGGTGMVGNAIKRNLKNHEAKFVGSSDYNLKNEAEVKKLFYDYWPDAVIHLAARVGGVKDNSDFLYDYFYENLRINTNVINQCKVDGIKNVIALSSTCVYPKYVESYPVKEEELHKGYPEDTNFGYAFAKRMMQVQMETARIQDKLERERENYRWSILYPSNLYGPYDTFDLQKSHVIPALVLKFHKAKMEGRDSVELYGTGKPLRQLTYVDDIANQIVKMIDSEVSGDFNFANPRNYSIAEIAQAISVVIGYNGSIYYNGKLDGVYRKDVDITKISQMFHLEPFTPLEEGLDKTYKWFLENK